METKTKRETPQKQQKRLEETDLLARSLESYQEMENCVQKMIENDLFPETFWMYSLHIRPETLAAVLKGLQKIRKDGKPKIPAGKLLDRLFDIDHSCSILKKATDPEDRQARSRNSPATRFLREFRGYLQNADPELYNGTQPERTNLCLSAYQAGLMEHKTYGKKDNTGRETLLLMDRNYFPSQVIEAYQEGLEGPEGTLRGSTLFRNHCQRIKLIELNKN